MNLAVFLHGQECTVSKPHLGIDTHYERMVVNDQIIDTIY